MSSIEKAVERMEKKSAGKSSSPSDSSTVSGTHKGTAVSDEDVTSSSENVAAQASHQLDFSWLEAHGFLTPEAERSKIAEEYRMIKRPLLINASGKGAVPIDRGNLIMVVSSLPGEGKTFTTMNLAMSMAMERDTTVLMVDSDVIKSSLTRTLGLEKRKGLIDVLLNSELELGDVIVDTDMPKLKVLPAGCAHVHSTELLASEQMGEIARELSERYPNRIVLFDGPPLLVTSQASVLAMQMGQIMMVVEAGKTPIHAVKESIALLDDSKVIGTILNKRRWLPGQGGYGGYSYGAFGN